MIARSFALGQIVEVVQDGNNLLQSCDFRVQGAAELVPNGVKLLGGELLLLSIELVWSDADLAVEVLAVWNRAHSKSKCFLGNEVVVLLENIVVGGGEGGVEFVGGVIDVAANSGGGEIKGTVCQSCKRKAHIIC